MHAIGIDIGGTKIAGAVVDEHGTILAGERIATEAGDAEAIVSAVIAMIERLAAQHPVVAAGVAAPGFIDETQSTVYYTPNISWRNEPLRERLTDRLDVEVTVDNDANAAGWAEFRFGVGQEVDAMTMLTIGTGVGGAIISKGELFRGGFGTGGELGHLRLIPDGLPCGCGARGCLEQYGSGRALLRIANEIADARGIGLALADARAEHGILDGTVVGRLIADNDPGAVRAVEQVGSALGQACASLAAVLDPELFVFGGGVAIAGDLLLDPVRAAFRQHLPARGYHPEPRFAVAQLANDAGMVGAADLARVHSQR